MALTDIQVKTAKPKEKDYKLSDAGGMHLFVSVAGGKFWRLKYRFDGKEKRLSLGAYPAVSLLEAREKRDEARKLLAMDIDPSDTLKIKKAEKLEHKANTFKVWAGNWLDHWQADKSPRHVGYTHRRILADRSWSNIQKVNPFSSR